MYNLDVFTEFAGRFGFFPTESALVLFGGRVEADHGLHVDVGIWRWRSEGDIEVLDILMCVEDSD